MSIVEVLVAMMIFAVISTGIIYAMVSMLSVTRDSRARQVALNLASEEIDASRTEGDLFQLLDGVREEKVKDTTYYVSRSTRWVTDPGDNLQCGTSGSGGGSALRYKRVNVEVTWDNMRSQTKPVRSDTVVSPNTHLNDPTLGTILVSVISGDGTGRPGVGVTASVGSPANGATTVPVAPRATDAQGCTYILKVTPGNYDVAVKRDGYVDHRQNAVGTLTVGVGAGESASAGFQYDRAATVQIGPRLPEGYEPAPGETLRVPNNLDTSFVSSYGTHVVGGGATSAHVFPFASGYRVLAGAYAEKTDLSGGCLAVDPSQWPTSEDGAPTLAPPTDDVVATRPGGTSTAELTMGVVRVGGAGQHIQARPAAPEGDDPGCAESKVYTFALDAAGAVSTATIALPPGTWTITRGASAQSTIPVGPEQLTVVTRGAVSAPGTVLLDPRVEVLP